jgi:chemotaxis signal transduction protein
MSDQQLDAWLLPVADNVTIAIGRYELKYIEHVTAGDLKAPLQGVRDFFWRGRYIPVLDVAALAGVETLLPVAGECIVAIVAYEDLAGNLLMGAIFLVDVPQMIHILPSQNVAVESMPHPWPQLAHAAFSYHQRDYPVLNLSALFVNQRIERRVH